MQSPIEIDPSTGLKKFNTRAASTKGNLGGKGYAVMSGDKEKFMDMPEKPAGAVFDAEEQAKYRKFLEGRATEQEFVSLEGQFSSYLTDFNTGERIEREALDDDCEILCVGAGFSGLLLWYKLKKAGFENVRFCEKGGDVGGTWYWNRYPGIACDVESYSYLPLLDETGYVPSMKFVSGFEIYEYCQLIAEKYGFYDKCLFHTAVENMEWDESADQWNVYTDRGDAMKARHIVLANGLFTSPRLSRIDGMEDFKGDSFHTARWNYDVDLKDKTVGIIGTGATGVQVVPEIAKVVKDLYVFQRTPSSIDVRGQRETTQEERDTWAKEEGWAKARRERYGRFQSMSLAMRADDDYLSGKVQPKKPKKPAKPMTMDEMIEKQLQSDFRIMEQIRERVDMVVEDPKTAAALKPYYPMGCKRPGAHDEYLPTFNKPNVHLVDTAPKGVDHINENGVVHDGKEYPLDVLIYATGFELVNKSAFTSIKGRNGQTLSEKWDEEGTKTYLGIHTNGFPNFYILTGPQAGGGTFNFIDMIESQTDYVERLLVMLRDKGHKVVDVNKEDEEVYSQHCAEADSATSSLRNCLSYFNNYGKAKPGSLLYYGGPQWFKWCDKALSTLKPFTFK